MTIARYPVPDRANYTPKNYKDEDGVIDIGWNEGITSDSRPFRAEMWAQDQASMLTIFMSALAIEEISKEDLEDYLEREGLIRFVSTKRYLAHRLYDDASNNLMWSINIVIGDEEDSFADSGFDIKPYKYYD